MSATETETLHVVVIGWEDGGVQVNGPYLDHARAKVAAQTIACKLTPEGDEPTYSGGSTWTVGEDGSDQIEIYVQPLAEPVEV